MYLYYYYFSIPTLLLSNSLILLNKSPLFMWMVMELNLMCFINILSIYKFSFSQISMNYFLIQSFNSYMFIMASLMLKFKMMNYLFFFIIFMSMISKMGIPPFHSWYLNLMKQLNWMIFYLNSSLQKFIPMFILSNFMQKYFMIFMLILLMVSPLMSIKSLNMKIIMSFSSIIQMLWMMIFMNFNEKMWINFFLIYNIITLSMTMMFMNMNINYTFELSMMKNSPKNMFFINFMIFSLASIPPFTGFINKWMFINNMNNLLSTYFMWMMLILSIMNLYFYCRMMLYNSLIFQSTLNKNFKFINYKLNFNNNNIIMMFMIFYIFLFEML